MNQRVIRVHTELGILSEHINELLDLTDLKQYGLPQHSVAYIQQIAILSPVTAFVLVQLVPAAAPTKKKGKAKP